MHRIAIIVGLLLLAACSQSDEEKQPAPTLEAILESLETSLKREGDFVVLERHRTRYLMPVGHPWVIECRRGVEIHFTADVSLPLSRRGIDDCTRAQAEIAKRLDKILGR